MLDERFRRRIADIAASDAGTISPEAEARILARVAAEGPAVVRGARRRRAALVVVAPLVAAAAAVAVLVVRTGVAGGSVEPTLAVAGPGGAGQLAAAAPARGPSQPACLARPAPAGVPARLDGVVELGVAARARAAAGAEVRVVRAVGCETELALDAGRVVVHARDLGGGELRVVAGDLTVSVRGTVFAVSRDGAGVLVEVAEGRVEVAGPFGRRVVAAGSGLRVEAGSPVDGALPGGRAAALAAEVGAPHVWGFDSLPEAARAEGPASRVDVAAAPAASGAAVVVLPESAAPAGPPGDPLGAAEQARRAGDYAAARTLYRQAGAAGGVAGEAAWVALARMELGLGHAAAALAATGERQARHGQGTLGPEALWIDVRAHRAAGDRERARETALELQRRWPASPQARAAAAWLAESR